MPTCTLQCIPPTLHLWSGSLQLTLAYHKSISSWYHEQPADTPWPSSLYQINSDIKRIKGRRERERERERESESEKRFRECQAWQNNGENSTSLIACWRVVSCSWRTVFAPGSLTLCAFIWLLWSEKQFFNLLVGLICNDFLCNVACRLASIEEEMMISVVYFFLGWKHFSVFAFYEMYISLVFWIHTLFGLSLQKLAIISFGLPW